MEQATLFASEDGNLRLQTRRVAVATLFGAVIFVTKTFPSPLDKMIIFPHALLLALGALLLRRMGATYVAVIGGVLTALWRPAFAAFSFVFAILYGLLIDGFFFTLKVHFGDKEVKTVRLITSMTASTALVGFLSSYVTSFFGLMRMDLIFQVAILVIGTLNGFVAGYLTSIIWNKRLRNAKL